MQMIHDVWIISFNYILVQWNFLLDKMEFDSYSWTSIYCIRIIPVLLQSGAYYLDFWLWQFSSAIFSLILNYQQLL